MSDEPDSVTDAEERYEGQEAEGVARIEAATELSPEERRNLDDRTLAELDDEERARLEVGEEGVDGELEAVATSARLSKNFMLAEFHCKDGTHVPGRAIPALRRLVTEVIQPMRDEFGQCTVTSGYRTVAHNRAVKGEENSQHIYDRTPQSVAADLTFAKGSPERWGNAARRRLGNNGGVGKYPSKRFVHVDNGRHSNWTG